MATTRRQAIGRAYGATNTPQFFVLDKERKIRYTGAMDDSQDESKVTKTYLRDAVDALLKGEIACRRRDASVWLQRSVQEKLTHPGRRARPLARVTGGSPASRPGRPEQSFTRVMIAAEPDFRLGGVL